MSFVANEAAAQKSCNDYFKTLPKKKTLKEILQQTITIHLLAPKDGSTYADVPAGAAAGLDIGVHPELFLLGPSRLACTLVHELAHVAGATTDIGAKNALAAENALKQCKCAKEYDDQNLGRIQTAKPQRYS